MPQRNLILGGAVLALNIWATAAHGVTNPAADFCLKEGGTYTVVKEAAGERGICTLPDGRAVNAWDYFRERHLTSPPATKSGDAADTIWRGGPILTMSDGAMRADALAVKDGRILAVGAEAQVMAHRGAETKVIDLAGRTMIPGFVDAHGHVFMIGIQALSANLLPRPDGEVGDIPALQATLRAYAEANPERVSRAGLLLGFGYDDAQLAEQRHPTRDDLDAVSTEIPIYVLHQSGHLGAANSKALEAAGISADTPNPAGGVIRRRPGSSEPNGVMEENASAMMAMALLRNLDADAGRAIFRAGTKLIASYGFTTAQEGRATPGVARLMQAVASEEGLDIDVVSYPDILVDRDFIANTASRQYTDRFRIGGTKLTIDGSPQGFTALRDRPYFKPQEGVRADYKGYASATADQVFDSIDWAFAKNIQILVHANGEGASDMLIAAIGTATEKHGRADRRPVLIHGQFLRKDQVAAYDRLDVFPSLFPMHTFYWGYWGDWHRDRTVGPAAAENISPTGWVLARGMKFSSHHDAPVAFPDSMRILDATVTRRSRSGDIIGPTHRVDVVTALKAMTIWPAYQHFEEDEKGSLEPGKLADLVILSDDPTAVDPETIDRIKVVETIKEGKTIYAASTREGRLEYRPPSDGKDQYPAFLRALATIHERSGGGIGPLLPMTPFMAATQHSNTCVVAALGDILAAVAAPNRSVAH